MGKESGLDRTHAETGKHAVAVGIFAHCFVLHFRSRWELLKNSGMVMWCDGVPDELKKASYRGGTDTGSAGFAGGNQYGHDWKN